MSSQRWRLRGTTVAVGLVGDAFPPIPCGSFAPTADTRVWSLVLVLPLLACRSARADEGASPRARLGMEGGLGFARAGPTWVGGTGIGLSGGVQATRWLGFEALVFGETGIVFYGRGHLAGLVTFSLDRLTLGIGGGVGALYALHYGVPASTASFGLGVLRLEVAFDRTRDGTHFALGAEGVLGSTFAGNVTEYEANRFSRAYPLEAGTPTGGARLYFGIRY